MESPRNTIESFVPAYLRRRAGVDPADRSSEIGQAAVLFADVSGFTPLANRLAEFGSEGAEELNGILNSYFGLIVDTVYDYGGDIIRFAGDSLLAIWPADGAGMGERVTKASVCGAAIQRAARDFHGNCRSQFGLSPSEIQLSLRINVTAGEIALPEVGGIEDKWQLLVVGAPLRQLPLADQHTRPGEVVLSPEAAAFSAGAVAGDLLPGGHLRVAIAEPPARGGVTDAPSTSLDETFLRRYVPRVVLARLDAGQVDFIGDLRQVSIVFIKLAGIEGSSIACCDHLQKTMTVLQGAAQQWNGEVFQLAVDDKGTVGILCFGLPHRTGDENSLRAVRAAMHVRTDLQSIGLDCGIGVATGKIFCGPVGTSRRREYSIHGSAVNLSARLMQAAVGEVLCDETTQTSIRGKLPFQELPRFLLKGFDAAGVRVFRPQATAPRIAGNELPIVGRVHERRLIQTVLDEARSGQSRVVLMIGEAGIGKSTLMRTLTKEAIQRGLTTIAGHCNSIERMTPYFAWRDVFQQLLGLAGIAAPELRAAKLEHRLKNHGEHLRFSSILYGVLDIPLPEHDLVKQLDGQARAERINILLLSLLEDAAQSQKLLIVIEDMHWLDSASWALALLVAQRSRASLVGTLRPLSGPPAEYEQLTLLPGTVLLNLESLNHDDTAALLERTLNFPRLAPELVDHLFDRSQGNPLFAEELALYLRDAGRLRVEKNVCRLDVAGVGDAAPIPDTILDVITNRIDQLSPQQQLTLKTASVVGRSFTHETVQSVYPVQRDRTQVDDVLGSLRMVDMIRPEDDAAEPSSLFRHVTIHDVAYRQLPVAQRKSLHRAVAEWYESVHGDSAATAPLLAYHWEKADEPGKTIHYLALSGNEAIRSNASREAMKFFSAALQIHRQLWGERPEGDVRIQRGRLTRQLAEAQFNLGQLEGARADLERAATLFGHTLRSPGKLLALGMLRQLFVQAWRLLTARRRRRRSPLPPEENDSAQECALTFQRLSHVHYFTGELFVGFNRALIALNLLEPLGDSPGLARAYANMCVVVGVMRLRRLARHYASKARLVAERTGNLPALSYVLNTTAMYQISVGNWEAVRDAVETSEEAAQKVGDQRLLGETLCVQAIFAYALSRNQECHQYFLKVAQLGEQNGNVLHRAWGVSGTAIYNIRAGRLEEAERLLHESLSYFGNLHNRVGSVHCVLAHVHARSGRFAAAIASAAQAKEILIRNSVTTCAALEGYAGLAEAYLLVWEHGAANTAIHAEAEAAQSLLRKFASQFPIARPRMLRCEGLLAYRNGSPNRAQRLWEKSLLSAQKLQMPIEIALACFELGRYGAADLNSRRKYLSEAIRLFAEIGAEWELKRARDVFAGTGEE